MKLLVKILILSILILSAKAQSTTNISFTIRVTVSGVSTNTTLLVAGTNYVNGYQLAYARNVAANGTNAPSFLAFIAQETADRLKSLQDEAIANQITTNKITTFVTTLPTLWSTMSAADQQDLQALAQKYAQ